MIIHFVYIFLLFKHENVPRVSEKCLAKSTQPKNIALSKQRLAHHIFQMFNAAIVAAFYFVPASSFIDMSSCVETNWTRRIAFLSLGCGDKSHVLWCFDDIQKIEFT